MELTGTGFLVPCLRLRQLPLLKKAALVPMDPPLPGEMRCQVPRSTLLYYLHHHLGYERVYTKKGGLLERSGSRHARIRKFVVEMHHARVMAPTLLRLRTRLTFTRTTAHSSRG